MKWFEVGEQPDDFTGLPKAFADAKSLWNADRDKNFGKIIKLLQPFVTAVFLPANIDGWEELFADPAGEGFPETHATELRLVGVDFSCSPIPMCKAEAEFEVPVTEAFGSIDLDTWQLDNDYFASAIGFGWNVPQNYKTKNLDLTGTSNRGVECIPL